MSVPVRPTKSTGGVVYVAGADILAPELNGDYDALDTALRNIDSTNLAATPNFPGTVIAAAPGGLPTDRYNDSTIILSKLKRQEVVLTPPSIVNILNNTFLSFDLSSATPSAGWSATGFFTSITYMFLGLIFECNVDNTAIGNGTFGLVTPGVSRSADGSNRTFLTIGNRSGITVGLGITAGVKAIKLLFLKDA